MHPAWKLMCVSRQIPSAGHLNSCNSRGTFHITYLVQKYLKSTTYWTKWSSLRSADLSSLRSEDDLTSLGSAGYHINFQARGISLQLHTVRNFTSNIWRRDI